MRTSLLSLFTLRKAPQKTECSNYTRNNENNLIVLSLFDIFSYCLTQQDSYFNLVYFRVFIFVFHYISFLWISHDKKLSYLFYMIHVVLLLRWTNFCFSTFDSLSCSVVSFVALLLKIYNVCKKSSGTKMKVLPFTQILNINSNYVKS